MSVDSLFTYSERLRIFMLLRTWDENAKMRIHRLELPSAATFVSRGFALLCRQLA